MNDQKNISAPTGAPPTYGVDLHCHSTASEVAKLGVQRALALPECATPPREVYELAKRRGMDFVTITDHDTIAGVLELADEPDVFVSEELTASFKGERQAVHVLCFGITPDDHDWLQATSGDVAACAEYLHGREIACALAHPFFHVAAPLTPMHRRTLADCSRSGRRATALARASSTPRPRSTSRRTAESPSAARTTTPASTSAARTPRRRPRQRRHEFLDHIRAGRVAPHGKQGSAAKWAHSALVLARAARTCRRSIPIPDDGRPSTPATRARPSVPHSSSLSGSCSRATPATAASARASGPRTAGGCCGLDGRDGARSSTPAACWRAPGRRFQPFRPGTPRAARRRPRAKAHRSDRRQPLARPAATDGLEDAAATLFAACLPAVPYIPAAAFLAREQAKLVARDGDPLRVAVIADGVSSMHGVTHTLAQLRERGIPGYEIDVIGTDAERRPPAVRRWPRSSSPSTRV